MDIFKLVGSIFIKNDEANEEIDKTTEKAEKSSSKIGKALGAIGKAGAVAIGASATAVTFLTKSALSAYADYEQLTGGVETLFGTSADKVMEYANKAYQTAGLSANEYMETVTSFSASLLQGLGGDTEQASEIANQAIVDMSDNANKMGTSMEAIQNAYNGFAKGNFTMLDNLKLGYGGTQEEMVRLMNDSGVLEEQIDSMNGISFDQMIEAIHAVQENLGITGTTAKEASTTISGSIASMKSAWKNMLTVMGNDSGDFTAVLNELVDSATTVVGNVLPRIQVIFQAIPTAIDALTPQIPGIVGAILPSLIQGAIGLLNGLVASFPQVIPILMQLLPQIIEGIIQLFTALVGNIALIINPLLEALPEAITLLITALMEALPQLIEGLIMLVISIVENLPMIIASLINAVPLIFDMLIQAFAEAFPAVVEYAKQSWDNLTEKAKQAWEAIKNVWKPVTDFFTNLWETAKTAVVTKIEDIKNRVTTVFQSVKAAVTLIWNSIKTAILTPIEEAKERIRNIIETIKGFFSGMKITFPHINLPHFSISPSGWRIGDLLKGSIPRLGIDWYAKAMDEPRLFTQPTLFDVNPVTGKARGAGEAGDEVMIGKDTMLSMIQSAVAQETDVAFSKLNKVLMSILDLLSQYIPELAGMQMVTDTGALVGALAPKMDDALGVIYRKQKRGV